MARSRHSHRSVTVVVKASITPLFCNKIPLGDRCGKSAAVILSRCDGATLAGFGHASASADVSRRSPPDLASSRLSRAFSNRRNVSWASSLVDHQHPHIVFAELAAPFTLRSTTKLPGSFMEARQLTRAGPGDLYASAISFRDPRRRSAIICRIPPIPAFGVITTGLHL